MAKFMCDNVTKNCGSLPIVPGQSVGKFFDATIEDAGQGAADGVTRCCIAEGGVPDRGRTSENPQDDRRPTHRPFAALDGLAGSWPYVTGGHGAVEPGCCDTCSTNNSAGLAF